MCSSDLALGAGRHERSDQRRGHRNGNRERLLATPAGDVQLRIPRFRTGSFFPSLLEPRRRVDRARIDDEWIVAAIRWPVAEQVQADGRIRRWVYVRQEARYLRVVLLADGETVHNAFFDRGFVP